MMGSEETTPPNGGEAPEQSPTEQPDPAEPAGSDDPGVEQEIEESTDREASNGGDAAAGEGPEDELSKARRERDEYLALAQRAQADFENYRKRAAREAADAGRRAKAGLVRELLPVVDNLERALASAGEGEQHLADGVRLVHSELVALLERNGVESFDPGGEQFDPELHEAMSTRPAEDSKSGMVLDVVEKGYRLNGTVLRPARVVVSA